MFIIKFCHGREEVGGVSFSTGTNHSHLLLYIPYHATYCLCINKRYFINVKSKFAMTGQLIVNRSQVFPALQLQLQLKIQDKVIIKLYNVMMTVEILQEVLETLKINGCIPNAFTHLHCKIFLVVT